MISASADQVEAGGTLVTETGDALRIIEQYIHTINDLMDAIATSSKEQSIGLNEVNSAVNQIDQVTQQNAAMVEETNAASAALAAESSKLRGLIARFALAAAPPPDTAKSHQASAVAHLNRRVA